MNDDHFKQVKLKITQIYGNPGYFRSYGSTFIFSLLLFIILIHVILFTFAVMKMQYVKTNWETEKCKPYILPFAGFINAPPGESMIDYTSENYQYCVQQITTNVSGYALEPLNAVVSVLTDVFSMIVDTINSIRAIINEIRNSVTTITGDILSKILVMIIPFQQIIIKFSDVLNKTQGILIGGLYTAFGIYFTIDSFFTALIQLITTVLIALVVVIFILFVFLQFPIAIPLAVVFAAICIPLIIIITILNDVTGMNISSDLPQLKEPHSCFDKNTLIPLQNGQNKFISDIQVGDVLLDQSIVHCHLILNRGNEKMFMLNGIIVSGTHPILYNKKWIHVVEHPDSQLITDYREPYLYCMVTSNKKIKLRNMIFSDWDDILKEDKYVRLLRNVSTHESRLDQIHRFYNKGLPADTLIQLTDCTMKPLKEIKIGDLLFSECGTNNKVYGIVTIQADDLIYGNLLDENMKYIKDLGKVYHLLTDTEYFYTNRQKFNDYNSCVDLYTD